jgi:hypothetical protein
MTTADLFVKTPIAGSTFRINGHARSRILGNRINVRFAGVCLAPPALLESGSSDRSPLFLAVCAGMQRRTPTENRAFLHAPEFGHR